MIYFIKQTMGPILEINENEYLIKLNRKRFNLSFVRSLLRIVEASDPAADVEINEARITPHRYVDTGPGYFGSLEEK